ncbi:histidine kinase dimerization/phosphoacceptor domain -containing protein [Siphonobacter sp.]|uniref:histidine kinase dimerization/phosphoacceptor domain -containing protein n=1 Tax=Siphonobacter sp. TaxID=1869184 RepID=UPI003B3A60B8
MSAKAQFDSLSEYESEMRNHTQFADAKMAIEALVSIAEKTKDSVLLSRAYFSFGMLEMDKSNPANAILYYQKALDISNRIKHVKKQTIMLDYIGFAYVSLKEYVTAENYFNKGLKLAEQIKDKEMIGQFNMELATVEDMRKNFSKALQYNQKALDYCEDETKKSTILLNRAIIYKNAGQYEESEKTYLECLRLADKLKMDYLRGYVYLNYPNTLIKLNRIDEAERYAQKALVWSKDKPEKYRFYVEIYDILTRIAEQRNEYKQALNFHKEWVVARDSVTNFDKRQELVDAETRFRTEEKELEIKRLDEENELKSRQFWWLLGGMSILLLLLVVASVQYRIIRKGNQQLEKTNRALSERNTIVSEQSEQLKNLMKELHHRVKNNLAIVSSLLRLQSTRLEDEGAVRAVREGQQRVEAMSLIHQRLYESDNVTKVNMKEYIHDLVQGLFYAYGFKEENFDLEVDIVSVELDVEVAVPLGLIMNEIITNAFKHAFDQISKPSLSIILNETDQLHLEIKDNGPGIDMNAWKKPTGSFGKRLILLLSEQIGAILNVRNENGTRFDLIMPVQE